MQAHPFHATDPRPAAAMAVPGAVPSCAVERGTPWTAHPVAGSGKGSAGFGLIVPGVHPYSDRSTRRRDGQDRYKQRGRTVARP